MPLETLKVTVRVKQPWLAKLYMKLLTWTLIRRVKRGAISVEEAQLILYKFFVDTTRYKTNDSRWKRFDTRHT